MPTAPFKLVTNAKTGVFVQQRDRAFASREFVYGPVGKTIISRNTPEVDLAADNIRADLDAVVKRSRGVAKQLNQGVTHLMKKNKIAVHMGEGVLKGGGKLEVKGEKGTETLSAKHIIIATGATSAT